MLREVRKYLYDALRACEDLTAFLEGKSFDDYLSERLLQSGAERQLMIIGEALNQADKIDPDISDRISAFRQIVNLRNVIVHGYATIENETIWGILQDDLPDLHEQLKRLLGEN
jgi:uncharacterized protein with HEPN domain